MKKSFLSRIIAVVLTLCMTFSMIVASTTTAHTENRFVGGLKDAGVDKLIELGVRGLCELTLGLSESMNEDAQESVESICSWVLMDASEAAIVKVQETCDEILQELYVIEDKLTDYTVDIYGELAKQTITKAKENYKNQWTKDVVDVMASKHEQMGMIYNSYLYYFILSNLLANGYPETEDEINALNVYLDSINFSISKSDVTQQNVESAKEAVDNSFELLIDKSITDKQNALYTNKSINMLFVDTIKALSDKLEREGYETQGEPNVLDRAATYAYFALPYSEQQHEFVSGTAQKQAMVIIMLELAYGEFLANQGEYLEKNNSDVESWADESLVTYGNHKVSYNSIKDEFLGDNKDYDCVLYAFDKISQMYSTSINIDASSYTGDYNDQVTYMGRYFQPEDAKSVELTISSFQNEYNYNDNKAIYELCDGLECTGLVTKANHFKSEKVRFNRIVPGNNSSQVYYILDASYYGELELRSLYNRIKREGPLGGSDNVYGDFHVASMDYINLRKEMSDGTNIYKCPSDLNTSLINLNKTVAFAAAYGSVPVQYYGKYLPVDPSANQNFKLLEDDYYLDLDLNFGDGPYMVRDADADFANLNKGTATDYKFNINNINFSSIAGSSDLYTVIVANTSGDYKQKVTLDYNSDSAQFLIDDGSDIITSSGTVKSGNDITLKIKPEDGNNIKSLKCIRKNAETTQTVLIDEGEAEYFYNEKSGYYEFNYNMPYSETQFVLETEKGIPSDSDGTFIIKSYGDLLALAENINNGNEKYKSGNYILANDIVCPANTEWSLPIGTYDKPFCGTFDGHNHVISGLTIRKDIDRSVGLFGALKGATIKNLHIKDASIDFETDAYNPVFDGPDRQVGVLCGEAYYESSISGCTVSGSVKVKGALEVGGMCGYATDTVFEKCINYCDVSSDSEYIGGLLASSLYITKLYNCANFGDVTADSSLYCGGIVGGGMANNYYIYNSYNVGKVGGTMVSLYSGDDYFIGALGGESPNVTNCYILDNNPDLKPQGTVCTLEQFKSGEVCYRLNITSVLPDYAWFQSIDNGETPDDYPTLDFKKNKIVFKVNKEDKNYSNTPNGYLLGDTDLDSNITIMDATLIQYHCALLYELTDMSLVNGDVNKDKIISITDATRIQAHIAGLMPIE